jgi:hypothetical protein
MRPSASLNQRGFDITDCTSGVYRAADAELDASAGAETNASAIATGSGRGRIAP